MFKYEYKNMSRIGKFSVFSDEECGHDERQKFTENRGGDGLPNTQGSDRR